MAEQGNLAHKKTPPPPDRRRNNSEVDITHRTLRQAIRMSRRQAIQRDTGLFLRTSDPIFAQNYHSTAEKRKFTVSDDKTTYK